MPATLRLRNRELEPAAFPMVMGILNVTPDSFSDGGLHLSPNAAVSRAEEMLSEGAGIIDVGPESTRPGSLPVDADEQIRRAVPVIAEIHRRWPDAILSVDTRLAAVADAAIDAGAEMVNDTAALRDDPALGRVVAESGAAVVLMHRRGVPAGMQKDGGPTYADVIAEIMAFFRERIDSAIRCGIEPSRIALDPGIGFGKRVEHNLEIVRHLDQFTGLDRPVVLGASRKRFIGEITGVDDPRDRMAGSLVCAVFGAEHGAAIIRAHDVRETVQTLRMWRGIRCLSSR